MASAVRLADGSYDFSQGVDSGRTSTVQGPNNPNGLLRSQLAWLTNGTVRGGGILTRTGFQPILKLLLSKLYQGGYLYEPQFANPYLMLSVAGRIYQCLVEAPFTITDLTAASPALVNPPTPTNVHMTQGEQFLVIQAGDLENNLNPTLPLFWDGTTLRRSNGLNPGGGLTRELPAAGPMVYYQGRIWYAQGRTFTAGDIVNGPSGTAPYNRRDSILKVTENPLAIGGDGFAVADNAGNIRALQYTSNDNATLGEGPLYIFTRKQIYQLTVPVTRADWIAATASNPPVQTIAQRRYGAVGDRCVVPVNGDLFYQTLEPAIRSLRVSVRNDNEWGNVALSSNEDRVLVHNDRALMETATGIDFNNRLLQAILPIQTPVGVAFQAMAPLDFDIISSFSRQGERPPPAWEGMYEGLDVLQLFEGDFGGLQRAFAVVHSRAEADENGFVDGIEVWEITNATKRDNGDSRITMQFETPAYNFQREFDMKTLDGGSIWLDKVSGTVDILIEYRPDADPCYQYWHEETVCAARDSCEDVINPVCYPVPKQYCEGYKMPIVLPVPPLPRCATFTQRPFNVGYQFQVRVTIKGWCRVRGIIVYGIPTEREPGQGLNC